MFDGGRRIGEQIRKFKFGFEFAGGWGLGKLDWEFKLEIEFEVENGTLSSNSLRLQIAIRV